MMEQPVSHHWICRRWIGHLRTIHRLLGRDRVGHDPHGHGAIGRHGARRDGVGRDAVPLDGLRRRGVWRLPRPALVATVVTATVFMLGGCGFQPLYMPTASGKAGIAQRNLATVYVGIIPERPGQLLRQALQERFGSDSGTPAAYDLNVSFGVAGEGIAIEADDLATRIRLIGTANWTLLAHDPKRTALTTGSARALDGVNVFGSQYFASDLETEAEQKRIAENIATQIATQLAVWFRQQAAKQAG